VTILAGDARETLATLPGPIGVVLLDGWKELCLPVLRLLEPRLSPGALVAADDNDNPGMADYLRYVREPANGYVSVSFPVADGVQISSWTGAPWQIPSVNAPPGRSRRARPRQRPADLPGCGTSGDQHATTQS
jgi:hypothetical protein